MKGLVSTLILAVFTVFLTSCGRGASSSQITNLHTSKGYETIMMSVHRGFLDESLIFIKAPAIELDKEKMEITIKEGYLASIDCNSCYAFRVENAKFSLPVGGRITITKKDGKKIVLERYGSFKMEESSP